MAGNKEAAIVDAVAALLLTVSGQVRASAPDTAAKLLAMRDELLKGNTPPVPQPNPTLPDGQ